MELRWLQNVLHQASSLKDLTQSWVTFNREWYGHAIKIVRQWPSPKEGWMLTNILAIMSNGNVLFHFDPQSHCARNIDFTSCMLLNWSSILVYTSSGVARSRSAFVTGRPVQVWKTKVTSLLNISSSHPSLLTEWQSSCAFSVARKALWCTSQKRAGNETDMCKHREISPSEQIWMQAQTGRLLLGTQPP